VLFRSLEQLVSRTWDLVHVIATFVFVAVLGAHLATLLVRRINQIDLSRAFRRAQISCLNKCVTFAAIPFALCLIGVILNGPTGGSGDAFPDDYSFKYGTDRPFAPSLARKDMSETENRLRSRILSALDESRRPLFLAGFKPDPNRHVGIVSVAEEICASFDLSPPQQAAIDDALSDARKEFVASGALSAQKLAGSESCGRCHAQIVEEWLPSAHRYASMDFVFQEVQKNFARDKAPEAVRYCAGCHDPIALFAGAKNVGNETLSVEGAHEGVSCRVCHAMVQTDVRGNADYTIAPQQPYLFESADGPVAQWLGDFLIRAYPQHHTTSYSRTLYKTAESCGACHKQFIDEEVNDFGWVQGQNRSEERRVGKECRSRWSPYH